MRPFPTAPASVLAGVAPAVAQQGMIENALRAIEHATFLTDEQKRDILYNNAARFLRLSEADRARHYGR